MRCNLSQLSEITGIGITTIKRRVADEGMPCIVRPKTSAEDWVFDTVGVIEYLAGRSETVEALDESKRLKLRQQMVDTGLAELNYAVKRGQLVDYHDMFEPVFEALAVLKSQLVALPGRVGQAVASESDPSKTTQIIKDEVNSMLEGLNTAWKKPQ